MVARIVAVEPVVELRGAPDVGPARNPSIVRTPLVIAMWESLARRLGWPNRQVGFSDVVRLAMSSRGLGQLGRSSTPTPTPTSQRLD